jgi:putative oxidoreductase
MQTRPLVYDVAALAARAGIGAVFVFHGWQKIEVGVTATARDLNDAGVPAATAAAVYSTFVELLGGVALIIGLGLPVAGLLLFIDMAGALVFVNGQNGLFVGSTDTAHQGFELVMVLGLASLIFALGAGGGLTVDRRLSSRRASRREEESYRDLEDGPVYPDLQPSAEELQEKPHEELQDKPQEEPYEKAHQEEIHEKPAEKPRLVADIMDDSSRDVLVAGRRRTKEES